MNGLLWDDPKRTSDIANAAKLVVLAVIVGFSFAVIERMFK